MSESSDLTKLNVNLEEGEADAGLNSGAKIPEASDDSANRDDLEATHRPKADSTDSPREKPNAASVEDVDLELPKFPGDTPRGGVDNTAPGTPIPSPPPNAPSVKDTELEEMELPTPPGDKPRGIITNTVSGNKPKPKPKPPPKPSSR